MFDILEHCQRYFDHFYLRTFFSFAIYPMNLIIDWKISTKNQFAAEHFYLHRKNLDEMMIFHITFHCDQNNEFSHIYALTVYH